MKLLILYSCINSTNVRDNDFSTNFKRIIVVANIGSNEANYTNLMGNN